VTWHTVRPQKQKTANKNQHVARIKKRPHPLKRTKPVNDCLLQKKTDIASSHPLPKLNCRHCPLPADEDGIPCCEKMARKNCNHKANIIDVKTGKTD